MKLEAARGFVSQLYWPFNGLRFACLAARHSPCELPTPLAAARSGASPGYMATRPLITRGLWVRPPSHTTRRRRKYSDTCSLYRAEC